MKKSFLLICLYGLLVMLQACTPHPTEVRAAAEAIRLYPDYRDVTIPYNIAPLNFLLRDDGVEAVAVTVQGTGEVLKINRCGNKVVFPQKAWKRFMGSAQGRRLAVTVQARVKGVWWEYPTFAWQVAREPIDAYVSYRLIEPGYEVWNALQLRERCVENFDERVLADNARTEGQCMNCHIHGGGKGELSFFHLRGPKGGTVLNRDGRLRKLSLKTPGMISAAVYGDFHPSGRYGVFSSNVIIPAFHAADNHRLEVYDTTSDLAIADFDENRMILSPLTTDSTCLETFPVFSADGCWVYFCSAPAVDNLPDDVTSLRYSLCRIAFDADRGIWGSEVDTLWNARQMNGSVCHPKASPDGRFLLYTVADYGTFPIWHRETELQLLDLHTGAINRMEEVNSNRSETYHSWSSNSRWFAFASKRGDGQYGRVYFAYVDEEGRAHRAFALPQQDPERDDLCLKSYNIPDLSATPVPFDAAAVERMYREAEAEKFTECITP